MNEAPFWSIVEASKRAGRGSFAAYIESLSSRLSELAAGDIVEFQRTFDQLRDRAYSWDLWGAAYLIGGGCSDDAFADFRSWLVSLGRETYERALADSESLADLRIGPNGEEDAFFEELAYVPSQVFEEKTGEPMPPETGDRRSEPSGEKWDEDGNDLRERFPKLFAKYGDG
jgi:hypothetical protein